MLRTIDGIRTMNEPRPKLSVAIITEVVAEDSLGFAINPKMTVAAEVFLITKKRIRKVELSVTICGRKDIAIVAEITIVNFSPTGWPKLSVAIVAKVAGCRI